MAMIPDNRRGLHASRERACLQPQVQLELLLIRPAHCLALGNIAVSGRPMLCSFGFGAYKHHAFSCKTFSELF